MAVRHIGNKLLLLLAATAVALITAEAITRLTGVAAGYGRLFSSEEIPHRVVDGVVLWGVRNPRYDDEDLRRASPDTEALVVVGLGDSILFGIDLPKDATYFEQARRRIAARSTQPVEMLNLAIPGYGTLQEKVTYETVADRIKPGLVVVHYWEDDAAQFRAFGRYVVDFGDIAADGRTVIRPFPLPSSVSDFLLVHSRLFDLATGVALRYTDRPSPRDWNQVAAPLAQIHARALAAGSRLFIIASTQLNGPTPRPTHDLDRVRSFGAAHGIEVIDLSEWLHGLDSRTIAFDGCHLNAEGHRIVGERFADYLLAHELKDS